VPSVSVMDSSWTLVSVEAKNHSFSPACCCDVCSYVFICNVSMYMPCVSVMDSTWTLVSVEAKNHSFSPACCCCCCCCAVCSYVFICRMSMYMLSVSVMDSTWTLVSEVEEATFIFSGMLLCRVFVCFHMSCEHVYAVCVCNGFNLDAG